jgi:hypothetical protein
MTLTSSADGAERSALSSQYHSEIGPALNRGQLARPDSRCRLPAAEPRIADARRFRVRGAV